MADQQEIKTTKDKQNALGHRPVKVPVLDPEKVKQEVEKLRSTLNTEIDKINAGIQKGQDVVDTARAIGDEISATGDKIRKLLGGIFK
jgi:hypothetical protein